MFDTMEMLRNVVAMFDDPTIKPAGAIIVRMKREEIGHVNPTSIGGGTNRLDLMVEHAYLRTAGKTERGHFTVTNLMELMDEIMVIPAEDLDNYECVGFQVIPYTESGLGTTWPDIEIRLEDKKVYDEWAATATILVCQIIEKEQKN